jgi:hypothetical protein
MSVSVLGPLVQDEDDLGQVSSLAYPLLGHSAYSLLGHSAYPLLGDSIVHLPKKCHRHHQTSFHRHFVLNFLCYTIFIYFSNMSVCRLLEKLRVFLHVSSVSRHPPSPMQRDISPGGTARAV